MTSITETEDDLSGYMSDTPIDINPKYPKFNVSFAETVLICNLPKVTEAKFEKLKKVITKLASKIGALSDVGVNMPRDKESGTTAGFAFVEYANVEDAKKAVIALQGYQLDKNHKFDVIRYDDVKDVEEVPHEYTAPTPPEYRFPVDTEAWKYDEAFRDQFCIRHSGSATEVMWYDGGMGNGEPILAYDGNREKKQGIVWCDFYMQFSSKGSYIATLIPDKGVILWGGPEFSKINRFPAPGVEIVEFSPNEKFMLAIKDDPRDPAAIKAFDVESGKLLRTFPLRPEGIDKNDPVPIFSFSPDDAYLARMGNGLISIFDTKDMRLLDRRSLSTPGLKEFQWIPKGPENILAYWCPEHGNAPAHVDIVSIPSRKKLRQKNLFNVSKCNLSWHPDGNYLAVKVVRHTKSKKTLYNNIELFSLRENGIPVEMLEEKDSVQAFAWEPNGTKFALVHAEAPSSTKTSVSFYDMKKDSETTVKKGKKTVTVTSKVSELNKIETLSGKQCNRLFWSPQGGIIVMASLGESAAGTLEFYDTVNKTLAIKEHYRATEVSWDPSGRCVATSVVQPIGGGHFKFAMDNGYIIWNSQGKQLYQKNYESFYQLRWRPREALLSETKVKEIIANLKQYEKRFDKAGKERARAAYLEQTKGKRLLRSAYREHIARLRQFYDSLIDDRIILCDGYDTDDEDNYIETTVEIETILKSKEDVVVGRL